MCSINIAEIFLQAYSCLFLFSGAYTAAVLVYDGETPTPEFGTLIDEASRLNAAGVNVFVVSLNYYYNQGTSQALVQSIASMPLVDHLWTNLSDWSTLSNTVAPTILANLQVRFIYWLS